MNKEIMDITLLCDNIESWIIPYIIELKNELCIRGYNVDYINNIEEINKGDIAFFLGCSKVVEPKYLKQNKHNIVVHESSLPKGKGWSPLTWQILEGKNEIIFSLFEAVEELDAGEIYLQKEIKLNGSELNVELKDIQGRITIEMIIEFIEDFSKIKGKKQEGEESYYPRRRRKDSELDIYKSIKEQFNLLRVVDNERYPAFFYINNTKYILKIYKEKDIE
jgi:methionyl-tRNA formyltransferase